MKRFAALLTAIIMLTTHASAATETMEEAKKGAALSRVFTGVVVGDSAFAYEDAMDRLMAGITRSDPEEASKAAERFGRLSDDMSRYYEEYATVIHLLLADDLNGAANKLANIQALGTRGKTEFDNFRLELEGSAVLYSLDELDGYIAARKCLLEAASADEAAARSLKLKALQGFTAYYEVLNANDLRNDLLSEFPAGFYDAWLSEQNGDITGALDRYQKLMNKGDQLAAECYERLNALYQKENRAKANEKKDGDLTSAFRIYAELADVNYYGAAAKYEEVGDRILLIAEEIQADEKAKTVSEALNNVQSALELYQVLTEYKYKNSAEGRTALEAKLNQYKECVNLENAGLLAKALDAYAAMADFVPAQRANERLAQWKADFEAAQKKEAAPSVEHYSEALSVYSRISGEGCVWVKRSYNELKEKTFAKGVEEEKAGNLETAIRYYKLAEQYDVEVAASVQSATMFALAMEKEANGDIEGALADYKKLSDAGNTEAAQAYQNLMSLKDKADNADERYKNKDLLSALAVYNSLAKVGYYGAAEQFNKIADEVYAIAREAQERGNYKAAEALYRNLAAYNYADSAELQKQMLEAEETKAALEFAQAAENELLEELAAKIEAGKYDAAVPELRKLAASGVSKAEKMLADIQTSHYSQAQSYIANGKFAHALKEYDKLTALGFKDAANKKAALLETLENEVNGFFQNGDFEKALKRAVELETMGVEGAAKMREKVENDLISLAQNYFSGGSNEAGLYLCSVADNFGNKTAAAMLNAAIAELRSAMRIAMLNGDVELAQTYRNAIDDYHPDIENVIYVDAAMPADAQPVIQLYSPVYYRSVNPDLAHLGDEDLYSHWLNNGIKEGRLASPVFDPNYYMQTNKDIWERFSGSSTDFRGMMEQYYLQGIFEDRSGCAAFNALDYMLLNPDVAKAYNYNIYQCINHYIERGWMEVENGQSRLAMINWQ